MGGVRSSGGDGRISISSARDEASQRRANSFGNFVTVAVATPRIQNVLLRSRA